MNEKINEILNEHNKAMEAYDKARLALGSINWNMRMLNKAHEDTMEEMSAAIKAVMKANRAVIELNEENK